MYNRSMHRGGFNKGNVPYVQLDIVEAMHSSLSPLITHTSWTETETRGEFQYPQDIRISTLIYFCATSFPETIDILCK